MSEPAPETAKTPQHVGPAGRTRSLTWRILALVIAVIMAVEILIYIPSIGRFWQSHMESALKHGYLTAAALVHEYRVPLLLTLFAGVCYWAFLPALRRRRNKHR